MSSESNIRLVRLWVEKVWNEANLELMNQFHPPSFENHGRPSNIEEARQWHLRMRATYPDLHYVIGDIFAVDDRVALRWTAAATQRGVLWDVVPPTNKTVTWSGMHMLRVVDNQIVEVWAIADSVAVLQQLGVKLQPATPQ